MIPFSNGAILNSAVVPYSRFKMTVNTANVGRSASNQFDLELKSGVYDFDIHWGDGNSDLGVTSDATLTHTYTTNGTYQVSIEARSFANFYYYNTADKDKILSIDNFGDLQNITSLNYSDAFRNCKNLTTIPSDFTPVSNVNRMFNGCNLLTGNTNGLNWNLTNISRLGELFTACDISCDVNFTFNSTTKYEIGRWFWGCTNFSNFTQNTDINLSSNYQGDAFRATNFNDPIKFGDISTVGGMNNIFIDSNLSNSNAEQIINYMFDWDGTQVTNATPNNRTITFNNNTISSSSTAGQIVTWMIANRSWTFSNLTLI